MSQTQSQESLLLSDNETYEQQLNRKQQKSIKKSKKINQSKSKEQKNEAEKQKKKPAKKKQQKVQKQKKQAPKRKPKSKKQGVKENNENKQKVLEYMQRQNRPYNLLNIFDNLHGKIKKPQLEMILTELTQSGKFSCKQFGKNKVYFMNQDNFDMNINEVQQVGSIYAKLKEEMVSLKEQNKSLNDQYRKLMLKKTLEDLELETFDLSAQIAKLKRKKELLTDGNLQKVDEQLVVAVEKEAQKLDKQLRKRKKLLKDCLDMWSEMTEKKVTEIADIMGIELV